MKWLAIAVGAAFLLLVVAWLVLRTIGARLPAEHRAEQQAIIAAGLPEVADRIRQLEAHPRWRRQLQQLVIVARDGDGIRYREETRQGAIAYRMRERADNPRFVTEITDASLPFGGRWSYALQAEPDGRTRVTITEDGVVRDPLFRAMARYVFGHDATLKAYLRDLGASFP
jgi:hypothetical protein